MAPPKGWISNRKGIHTNPIPRFWKKIIKRTDSPCWDWSGWKNFEGYGYIRAYGKDIRINRFSYKLHKGEIPKDKFVCHSCDNPSCCNPDHLWLGDNTANMRDMRAKGRANDRGRARGEKQGLSKLTKNQVRKIRKLFETGNYTKIALGRRFKVSGKNITNIINHVTWFWLI